MLQSGMAKNLTKTFPSFELTIYYFVSCSSLTHSDTIIMPNNLIIGKTNFIFISPVSKICYYLLTNTQFVLQPLTKNSDIWNTRGIRSIKPTDISRRQWNSQFISNSCSLKLMAAPFPIVLFFEWSWFLDSIIRTINREKTQLPFIANKPSIQSNLSKIKR